MNETWPVVDLPGLMLDSLGHYLAALGLLRVATDEWALVRGAWRDERFALVAGPSGLDDLVNRLCARRQAWPQYAIPWREIQKQDTKDKTTTRLTRWRAEGDEELIESFDAHIVIGSRRFFNPLTGKGGNIGKRKLDEGWKSAFENLFGESRNATPRPGRHPRNAKPTEVLPPKPQGELSAFLLGEAVRVLGDWNAGGWFADAVEAYNSGQRPSAKGQVSPWAMLLACAGLPLFAGSASRRLGARTQARAAFPFVTEGAAPTAEREAGRIEAEVWAPVWERPMTLAELRMLLLRGRAEVGGRGAATPAAFAAAAVRRGVDAGIREFRRFTLIHTTSTQTFEPRLATVVRVPRTQSGALGDTLEAIADLRDRLPRDEKRGKRWIFRGLRGPLDASLIDVASDPDDPERLRAMLDAVADALTRVDRNRSYRKAHTSFRLLPPAALTPLFGREPPGVEVRIAIALASLRASPQVPPFVAHAWGVVIDTRGRAVFPETVPAQRVCIHGDLERDLAAVVRRRLVDANPEDVAPFAGSVRARASDLAQFLAGSVDDGLLGRWIRRAALFDWTSPPASMRLVLHSAQSELPASDGPFALYALIKPLFEPRNVTGPDERPLIEPRARRVAALARIAALLEAGSVDRAVDEAFVRYRMSGRAPAGIHAPLHADRPLRLLAALAIPTSPQLGRIAVRWLRPQPE